MPGADEPPTEVIAVPDAGDWWPWPEEADAETSSERRRRTLSLRRRLRQDAPYQPSDLDEPTETIDMSNTTGTYSAATTGTIDAADKPVGATTTTTAPAATDPEVKQPAGAPPGDAAEAAETPSPKPAAERRRPTRGDRVRTAVRGVGQTLITLGLVVLLFVVYELWITDLFNARTQRELGQQLQEQWERPGDDPLVRAGEPQRPGEKITTLPIGDGFANIYIPAFGPDYVRTIVEGTGLDELARGPGHYTDTALPGHAGNFAVAGHRVSNGAPFLNLDKLRAGDAIVIETKTNWFTYRVLGDRATGDPDRPGAWGLPGRQIVSPSDIDVIAPRPGNPEMTNSGRRLLTLTTCHPKFSARQRLIIHAELQGKAYPKSQGFPPALTGG